MSETVLFQMKNTHRSSPGAKTPQGMDLELRIGKVHALLGENGASKFTLIKVLGGIYIAEEDEIFIDGQKVAVDGVNASHNNGVPIIYRELVLVPHIIAAENIFLGREPSKGLWVSHETMEKEVQQLLGIYHMSIDVRTLVKDPAIVQRQMVEIAKAVSYHSRILVMDESTSPISDKEVEFLLNTMRKLTGKGTGVVYISHKMDELERICDQVTVLRGGTYVGTERVRGTTRGHLIAMMVNQELTRYYTRDYIGSGRVVLKCENIVDGEMAKEASFELHEGEIAGFTGLISVGRSETMKCIFGPTPGYTSEISVDGKRVTIKSPIDVTRFGIVLVPEDRKQEGLYKVQSVWFNSTIEVLKDFIKGIWMDTNREEGIARQYVEMMDTRTPSQRQLIGNLSGGDQQKIMIGRWLATVPKVLILGEPTRGVDVGAKSEIYGVMNELMKKGVSVIMVSPELPEILNMSDRVHITCDNRITGCFSHEECATQEQIMKLAAK